MFNFGFFELILLFVIAVVFVGPEQLPAMAKTLLKLLNQWKQVTDKVTNTVKEPFNNIQEEISQSINESREVLLKEADDIKDVVSMDEK